MYLKLWDVGGQLSLRKLWQSYYASCHAIVFIIDSTDIGDGTLEHENSGRLEECRLVLEDVLQNSETEGVPLLILANKQDREDCVETIRIKEGLVKKVMEGDKAGSIRDSRVVGLRPSNSAAPPFPLTFPPASLRTLRMWFFWTSSRARSWPASGPATDRCSQSPNSSSVPCVRMTALSTRFSSSRTLPGHS